ncbi:hypothetical protein [Desulfogranum mediterraneum]|uniref:hypothetical protein n=1 Tax=Desulfogranum mediterraneum TaxID=160661 RepID=UPI0004161DE5|nr:hypothetical protein [Desulfogranum mediterraneum]
MLNHIDTALLKVTEVVPEKWGGPVLILSFLVLLNILDYLIVDERTYGVVAAIFLVVWMVLGMRLTAVYQQKK